MKKVEINLQTAKDLKKVIKSCICKDKQNHECEFAKEYYHKMTRELNCSICPIKYLSDQLKDSINNR